ncbi:choice-of-anchor B family protein [Dokdonia sp. Hel_I_53]|uniref:choice-of-anchor B family protein n=1 Tax=Dokdonia sp. Hel_I_53 TaxID=1566287 RepID=UPI00119B4E91|nr:choice-of-anchor B family protein [Dokdonia sp. Hel_I_53]TVZ52319.1 choice-of-anchor B domain-containing protein [Dokdonia sp. Hel_I_53]
MKLKLVIFFLGILTIACREDDLVEEDFAVSIEGRVICQNGLAGSYACDNYDIMSRISNDTLGVTRLNDLWGWTDPNTQKEYALLGTYNSTIFIDISLAESPKIIGYLPSNSDSSNWRDIKVYENHAYIVSEAENHGMQVFDLTRLRNPQEQPMVFNEDVLYTIFTTSHNLVINKQSGYAYAVGSDTFNGGVHIINIQNPQQLIFEGGFDFIGYTHDAQAITYNGPDLDHVGKELLLSSNEDFVTITDVTNKSNPTLISRVAQDNVGYIHQGWIDESHRYFYANDELDEAEFGFKSRTLVFDFTDLDNPVYRGPYLGPTQAIDHNLYTNGTELFLSNYTNGVRIVDITESDPALMSEIGFFDTYPQNDDTIFDGAWSVYPYFESGNIIISDISNGLFIIRKTGT